MLLKKIYLPIGLCLVLLVAIGFLSLHSDVPEKPIMIYKAVEPLPKSTAEVSAVGDTSQGGHFHADGTWHAEPHSKADDDAAFEAEMAAYDAEAAQLDAEYEARAKRMKEKAAYIAKLEAEKAERIALEEELGELITWGEGFQEKFFSHADKILPLKELTHEEFLERFPTVDDRINHALELLKFEDYRKEVVTRFEGASPKARQLLYQELENIGYLDEYKRLFLQPNPIPEYVAEFIQANLDEEAKAGGNSQ